MVEADSEEEAWDLLPATAREAISDFDYERSPEDDKGEEQGDAQIYALKDSRMTCSEPELIKQVISENCVWRENEDGIWDTGCGKDFVFDLYAGQKPSDNGKYCSNCGKEVGYISFNGSKNNE